MTAIITSLAFSPDGSRLASAGFDDQGGGFVDLFDGRSLRYITRLGVAALIDERAPLASFSPDSRVLAVERPSTPPPGSCSAGTPRREMRSAGW